jgi:hypothetical protein
MASAGEVPSGVGSAQVLAGTERLKSIMAKPQLDLGGSVQSRDRCDASTAKKNNSSSAEMTAIAKNTMSRLWRYALYDTPHIVNRQMIAKNWFIKASPSLSAPARLVINEMMAIARLTISWISTWVKSSIASTHQNVVRSVDHW